MATDEKKMGEEKTPLLINVEDPNISPLRKFWNEFMEAMKKKENLIVLLYVVLYVCSGVFNGIMLKKTMNCFQNYPFFLTQLLNYGYIPVFGGVVLYQILFTNNIPPEMRQFPWWKFFIMGALDAVNGYIVVIGGVDTSGPLQQLLNQAIIPFTMIGAFIFLKERYSWVQMGGSAIIIGGVVVSLLPSFTGSDNNGQNKIFFNIFYLTQAVPGAASNVYKDVAFKSVELDVWYLQFWDVFWQSIVGTFLFPINAILPPPAQVPFASIPDALKDGGLCLAGHNQITTDCTSDGSDNSTVCDNCHNCYIVLGIYMCVNVAYNVFILLVIKYGSATILSIAQTIRLPLTNVFFSFRFIMGDQVTPFSSLSIAGLIIILTGLTTYRVGSQLRRSAEGGEDTGRVVFNVYSTEFQPIHKLLEPRSSAQLRSRYMNKLGIFPQNPPNPLP